MNERQWCEDDVAGSYNDDAYECEVVSDFRHPGFAAECGCGWASGWYLTTAEASAACEMHQEAHR